MLEHYTLTALASQLRDKKISSRELTEMYVQRIAAHDPILNAFITVTQPAAMAAADAADQIRAQGLAGALTGVPMAHKDLFCTEGVLTTCGSKMLANFVSPYDATVVDRLKQAGMVSLGKLNMDEFAMGSTNETSFYGAVKNPWQHCKISGGSSGGSAAAVAARLIPAATATDTGGSIREPAAFCGITGIKPSYGRVSRFGMIAFASSLDQGGVLAQTAEDCALMLGAMSGFDPKDSTSSQEPVPDFTATLTDDIAGLKIGIPEEFFGAGLDPAIAKAVEDAIAVFKQAGCHIRSVKLPNTHLVVPAYYVLAPAEASSNLSRFDGVRFGYRCADPVDLTDLYVRSRSEGFGAEVKRRILIGTYALSAGYYDAYYRKAQQIRRMVADDYARVLSEVDVLLGPTTPTVADDIGSHHDDPTSVYLNDIFTIGANLAGLPAMSLPVGFTQGLPIGMQLIGRYDDEATLLNVAHRYQQITDWHSQVPTGY